MAQPKRDAAFFVSPDGTITPKAPPLKRSEAKAIYERDNRKCRLCKRETLFGGNQVHPFMEKAPGHVDHILPRSRGGQNDGENLRLLCMSCNSSKGSKLDREWRQHGA